MKKDTISTGAFWIGAFGAFASLRRINKFVRPVNHNPIADLAILGVEVIASGVIGGGCSIAADAVVSRYEKWKEEKKKEKEEEEKEEKEDDFEDEFSEGEPVDPEDGIHFTVISTETNEDADNKESDIFNFEGHSSLKDSTDGKGSEADGDV